MQKATELKDEPYELCTSGLSKMKDELRERLRVIASQNSAAIEEMMRESTKKVYD